MTKIKIGIASAVALASLATPLVVQHQSVVSLRQENEALRQLQDRGPQLASESERLSDAAARASKGPALSEDQLHELLRLRGEIGVLRQDQEQLARLREEKRQLLARADELQRVATALQTFEDNPTEALTADRRRVVISVRCGWSVANAAAFASRLPNASPLVVRGQIEASAANAKAAVIGRHNASDLMSAEGSGLNLAEIEKQIQTTMQNDLTAYGIAIQSVNIGTLRPY